MKKSIFLLLALVFVLSGCATLPSDVDLDSELVEESEASLTEVTASVAVGEVEEDVPAEVTASVGVESSLPDGWTFFESKDSGYVLTAPMEFHFSGGADIMTLANYDTEDLLYVRGNADGLNIQIQTSSFEGSFEEQMLSMGNTPVSLGDITYSNYTSDGPGGAFQQYFIEGENQIYYMILVFEPGYTPFKELAESIVKTFELI
jgi:hypothetical protein